MSDPVYRYRSQERAANVEPGDLIASASLGGFHEVARVMPIGDKVRVVHTRPNTVSILQSGQRLDLLRPDSLPHYLQKENSDG